MNIPNRATIPIVPAGASSSTEAGSSAMRTIARYLSQFYSAELLEQHNSAAAIAGQWIALMPGREPDDHRDVEQFVEDLLLQIQMQDQRSLISDALSVYLGGIMPTYSKAKVLVGMLADRRPALEVEAYFHYIGYGSVTTFIESRAKGHQEGIALYRKLLRVLQSEAELLDAEEQRAQRANDVQLAFVSQMGEPSPGVVSDTARLLRFAPAAVPAARVGVMAAIRLAPLLLSAAVAAPLIVLAVVVVAIPIVIAVNKKHTDELRTQKEQEELSKQAEKVNMVRVPIATSTDDATTNTATNNCQPQTEKNKKNGADCENDGYVLMEQTLQYRRLVDPPKGKGLDGLFEKMPAFDKPDPMPREVAKPKPGKLVFIPQDERPPRPRYDYTGNPPVRTYPKFVVWEAKHVAKSFEENDHEGIKQEAKNRLKNTCDGQQMGVKWTEVRIPQALERQNPGAKNRSLREDKLKEIKKFRYSRWLFICLPGSTGSPAKLYVLIDVVASDTDLDSKTPRPRKQDAGANANTY